MRPNALLMPTWGESGDLFAGVYLFRRILRNKTFHPPARGTNVLGCSI